MSHPHIKIHPDSSFVVHKRRKLYSSPAPGPPSLETMKTKLGTQREQEWEREGEEDGASIIPRTGFHRYRNIHSFFSMAKRGRRKLFTSNFIHLTEHFPFAGNRIFCFSLLPKISCERVCLCVCVCVCAANATHWAKWTLARCVLFWNLPKLPSQDSSDSGWSQTLTMANDIGRQCLTHKALASRCFPSKNQVFMQSKIEIYSINVYIIAGAVLEPNSHKN